MFYTAIDIDKMNSDRRRIASRYLNEITNPEVVLPTVVDSMVPVWHIFGLRCKNRTALEKHLNDKGIGTNKHYPIPIHMQDCYKDLGYKKGDSIPVCISNIPEFDVMYLASSFIGATINTLGPDFDKDYLVAIF